MPAPIGSIPTDPDPLRPASASCPYQPPGDRNGAHCAYLVARTRGLAGRKRGSRDVVRTLISAAALRNCTGSVSVLSRRRIPARHCGWAVPGNILSHLLQEIGLSQPVLNLLNACAEGEPLPRLHARNSYSAAIQRARETCVLASTRPAGGAQWRSTQVRLSDRPNSRA
jgi:hypothetical protein